MQNDKTASNALSTYAGIGAASECLRKGGLVAFPTETVYGLGANVFNESAIARIFEVKQRPRFDPLIVHVADRAQLALVVDSIPPAGVKLMERFWPGPLTLIMPKSARVPDLVTAGLPGVAVRMPHHEIALELIRRAGMPLAAPSANPFGRTSPTLAWHVREFLGDKIDAIIDGGAATIGIESTIISLMRDQPVMLRPGGLPLEDIEQLTGPLDHAIPVGEPAVKAPGMLPIHYAPFTPLQLLAKVSVPPEKGIRAGALMFCRAPAAAGFDAVEILSSASDLREAAANLFAAIRRLDHEDLDVILAERVPGHGLGVAINDRLTRASAAGQT